MRCSRQDKESLLSAKFRCVNHGTLCETSVLQFMARDTMVEQSGSNKVLYIWHNILQYNRIRLDRMK